MIDDNYCALHDTYAQWQDARWREQEKKNETLTMLCSELAKEIVGIKLFMAKITAVLISAMTIIQLLAPYIWKKFGV